MAHDASNADFAEEEGPPDEELVAYLDGELDDESQRRVEDRVAADPKARESLARLERTWDILDTLSRAHVDETFTQTTLEMVAVAAADDVERVQEEIPRLHRRRWLLGSAGLVAAAAAGFVGVALWPDPNQQLLRDLPVLENLDQYHQVGDIEFLRLLHEKELFAQEDNRGS